MARNAQTMALRDKPPVGSRHDDGPFQRKQDDQPMQPSRIRTIVRWIHLSAAALIGVSVYSPWSGDPVFAWVLKYMGFPLLGLTGLVLWQQARLLRLRNASRSALGGNRP